MRLGFALVALLAATAAGCATQQLPPPAAVAPAPVQPLPFKGRLASGEADQLPPAVAMSLSEDSPIAFSYREELTHSESHVPLMLSALNPATYAGAGLGEFRVNAFASLSITRGDDILGDYTATATAARSYSMYSEPTHSDVEQEARVAVREKIDEQLYANLDHLKRAAGGGAAAK
jgi:hypothetical protein